MSKSKWRCDRCGSNRWVGYRAHPIAQRMAQCVPCGRVQPLPDGEPQ